MSRLLAAAVVLAALTAVGRPAHVPATPPRIVLFALDGGTWDLLDPFIDRGLLPNLQRLRDGGTAGVLRSFPPLSSPVVWTTIATGKEPAKHGITEFTRFPLGRGRGARPVSSNLRTVKAFWNVLSEAGQEVVVVGWFVSWPPEDVNGVIVSDRAHHRKIEDPTHPEGVLDGLARTSRAEARAAAPRFIAFPEGDPTPAALGGLPNVERFLGAYRRDAFYRRAARRVLDQGHRGDVFALYLRATDDVQHAFWKFMDPAPFGDVPVEQVDRLGRVIERVWQWTDQVVGEVLATVGDDVRVLVVSDHGFGPAVGGYAPLNPRHQYLSGAHREDGIVIAYGPGIRRGARIEGATTLDVTPTILYARGLPVARDLDGRVLRELFEPAVLARAPVRHVATYERGPRAARRDVLESGADEEILEHLRALGYVE